VRDVGRAIGPWSRPPRQVHSLIGLGETMNDKASKATAALRGHWGTNKVMLADGKITCKDTTIQVGWSIATPPLPDHKMTG
jgi:hypothetical protein